MKTTIEDVQQYLAFGREQRGVEFKAGGPLDDGPPDKRLLFAKVARAMIALANKRDGGVVILGVEEEKGALILSGLAPADAATWTFDGLGDKLRNYADPPIDFGVQPMEVDGRVLIVIEVKEFGDIPILCRKPLNIRRKDRKDPSDFRDETLLRDGALYVRGLRKNESVEVPSHAEMRELIDLAIDKGGERLLARMSKVLKGGLPGSAPSDDELFDEQRRRLP